MHDWCRAMFRRCANRTLQRENAKLRRQCDELRSELEAERRRLGVANAEIETLSAVIARDRSRIQSEMAAYQRKRAEAEGRPQHEQSAY